MTNIAEDYPIAKNRLTASKAKSQVFMCDVVACEKESYDKYYQAKRGTNMATILIRWDAPVNVGHVVLKENVWLSQRVEAFRVEAMRDGEFETVYEGTVIGHKRIIPFREGLLTNSLRIVITDSRMEPTIAFLGIYEHI